MSEANATTKDAPIAFAIAVKYVQKHQPEHMQAGEQFDMTTFLRCFVFVWGKRVN